MKQKHFKIFSSKIELNPTVWGNSVLIRLIIIKVHILSKMYILKCVQRTLSTSTASPRQNWNVSLSGKPKNNLFFKVISFCNQYLIGTNQTLRKKCVVKLEWNQNLCVTSFQTNNKKECSVRISFLLWKKNDRFWLSWN